MDPDTALEEMLKLASMIVDSDKFDLSNDEMRDAAIELASSALALHDWMRMGGFAPKEWKR
jgi:hypothetical protein